MTINPEEEIARRTRKRVTRRLIPFLMFLYILAYLDRTNLGVAKLQMQPALGFSDAVIGFGAGIYFLGFLILDIPGSLIVERWSARKWIARIMISWGIVAALMGFLGTRLFSALHLTTQFYSLRLLLGITEAGFFPGVIVYISHWYRPEDRARAKGYFMVATPVAVAIGVPATRWILDTVHWAGIASWRWVFILEGVLPFLMGFVALWYLTDRPGKAAWLPHVEQQWLIAKLDADEAVKTATHRVSVSDALRNPQTFLLIALYFLVVTGNQALIFFLPSITNSMQTLPHLIQTTGASLPYVCSACGIMINGIWAQRTGNLRWHTALPILATSCSLAIIVLAHNPGWFTIIMFCLAGFTSQAYLPAFWTIPTTLLGKSAAATAVGLICLGNLGGFVGPWLFGYLRTRTGTYNTGILVLAGCMFASGLLATLIRLPQVVPHIPYPQDRGDRAAA
jgi:ACS family tartrate transporter-like MFS transporter